MASMFVVYGSGEGQTRKVAATVADDVEAASTGAAEGAKHTEVSRLTWTAAGIALLLGVVSLAYWAAARTFTPAEC